MTTFPDSAQRLFTNAIANHTVSIADRYDLMSALLDRDLEAAEFAAVDQLVQSLQAANRPKSAIVPTTVSIWELQPRQLQLAS